MEILVMALIVALHIWVIINPDPPEIRIFKKRHIPRISLNVNHFKKGDILVVESVGNFEIRLLSGPIPIFNKRVDRWVYYLSLKRLRKGSIKYFEYKYVTL